MKIWGTHRAVYLTERYAIKRPVLSSWKMFLRGLLANMQEASFSKLNHPGLCPVIFAFPGGWFNVMRRASRLSEEEFQKFNYAEFIKGGYNLPSGEWILPVEKKSDSFGKLDGRIVAVDYGT